MQVVFGSACAFVPWLEGFLVLRFLTAAAIGGIMITSFVICKYNYLGRFMTTQTTFVPCRPTGSAPTEAKLNCH
jgi:hypothetical protein